jgi:eukaryotic-like serine/threonine-protein kinase
MPQAPDLTGCALDGRYELHALIGEGAFGRVYRGRDRRLRRTVAIKVIKPWWTEDPEWGGSFEREAQLLARVSDPGIVQIFDVGHAEEGLYYVSELVDGESLASRLRRGALAPWHASGVAEQLCRALAHAHARGIVHRDVKPANILLSAEGRVKVGDFGVARLAEGSTDGPSATIVGTPRYMAPEQARGWPTSPATDVYSVGVVLYEMLAGSPPFTEKSAVELALRHVQDPPPRLPDDTPRELVEIVDRALAKDPAERYAGGAAMGDALARARRTVTTQPPDATARDRVRAGSRARGGSPPTTRRAAGARERSPVGAGTAEKPPTTRGAARPASRSRPPAPPLLTRARDRASHGPDPTRVAPRYARRRNLNPAARRRTAAALTLAFLLLAGMAGAALLLGARKRVEVPNLIHLSRSTIDSRTKLIGLVPRYHRAYDRAPRGTAIDQTPRAHTRAASGTMISIVLSRGLPPVPIPQVVGQASVQARSALERLGLHTDVTLVPAPGVSPGTVSRQTPAAASNAPAHSTVSLSVAEAPQWRPLTSIRGSSAQASVPFRIRGTHFRVLYSMGFQGTCTFLFICSGPNAEVANLSNSTTAAGFDLNDGSGQTRVVQSGPGIYQIRISPGSDTASWSIEVEDYY